MHTTYSSNKGACHASSEGPLTTARPSEAFGSLEATLPKCSVIVMPGASTTATGFTTSGVMPAACSLPSVSGRASGAFDACAATRWSSESAAREL